MEEPVNESGTVAGDDGFVVNFVVLANSLGLFWALGGVVLAVLVSRWLDARAGVRFRDALDIIRSDPRAAARYYGQRFLGICLLVGLVIRQSV
jgi:hypothetical protein